MLALITEAVVLYQLTDGLFDPSVLNALRLAGYDRNLDEIRGQDLPPGHHSSSPSLPFDQIRLDPETGGIRLMAGMQIDLGGIAKGWIASRAAELLLEVTEVCVVGAGGDMALVGLPATASAWEVGLEDPGQAERVLAVLRVQPGGLATSTVTRRRWSQAGVPRHHIIDPRSGAPSDSPWLSVTVSHPSPTLSEAFAKALLVAGPSAAPVLAARAQGLKYLAIGPAGEMTGNFDPSQIISVPEPVV
jgi:thiamine biosynthesis lipoprotein